MKLFIPVLRDDFTICETYDYQDDSLIRCPLTALGGDADTDVPLDELTAWSAVAGDEFEHAMFHGDHFFIHPNKRAVIDRLRAIGDRHGRSNGDLRFGG